MPRIYDSASDPRDFCRRCYPKTEAVAEKLFGDEAKGPDGRGNGFGYDAEHPPYEECGYECEVCHAPLSEKDN